MCLSAQVLVCACNLINHKKEKCLILCFGYFCILIVLLTNVAAAAARALSMKMLLLL